MTYNPKSEKSLLSAYMYPSGKSLYPPSDITSYVTNTTAPSYTSQQSILWNDANATLRYRHTGTWYNASGNGVNSINGATVSDTGNWTSWEVEFYVNGADVAIWTVSLTNTDWRIYVDDMPLTTDWQLTSSGTTINYHKIQFASSKVRKIRFFGSGLMSFTGVYIPGASDIWAAPPRFKAAIIGDSYVQGGHNAGASEGILMSAALCNQLAIQTGWEVINLGQGSTGYINNASNTIGKDYYGASSRMTALAALPALDLIIPYGSGNDSSQTSGAVTTAVNSLWDAIKAARPTTAIIPAGVEPGSPTGFTPSLLDSTNTAMKTAAAANTNISGYIDMRLSGDNWVVGTGNAGTPADNGNSDFFISSDGVHPTRAGYYNMAWRMVQELGKIKV